LEIQLAIADGLPYHRVENLITSSINPIKKAMLKVRLDCTNMKGDGTNAFLTLSRVLQRLGTQYDRHIYMQRMLVSSAITKACIWDCTKVACLTSKRSPITQLPLQHLQQAFKAMSISIAGRTW
jgi:hypothetical protein